MKNDKNKLLFFFGSGADSDFTDRLPSGKDFSKYLLTGEYDSEAVKLIGDEFKDYKLIHPNSTKVFLQTVVENESEARRFLKKEDVEKCIKYVKNRNDCYDEIRKICNKWYNNIFKKENEDENITHFFLNNAVFFDSLDEKFNSLRNTDFNDNARRVINAYTQIFILMMKRVYQVGNGFPWNYGAVFEKLSKPYDIPKKEESYYCILGKMNCDTKIITTNYTELASTHTGLETIYLHGKLTWFEDLKRLRVFDCTKEMAMDYDWSKIIPFILIPSGVKPLICTKQLEEYSKFLKELNMANTLFVVGYKFNSEDNHINSIIADWLRKEGNKLIYLNFKGETDFSFLKWADDFQNKKMNGYDNSLLDKKINNIVVDEKNSIEVFRKILGYLKDQERNPSLIRS